MLDLNIGYLVEEQMGRQMSSPLPPGKQAQRKGNTCNTGHNSVIFINFLKCDVYLK